MISGRAELAKEEYATTWQEEVKGQPQAERGEPEVGRGAQDEAQCAFARRRIPQDQRPQGGFPEECGEASSEEDCEAPHRRP